MSPTPVPEPGTPILDAAGLTDAWAGLMGPGGFTDSTLWLMFLDDDGRLKPLLVPIEPLPAEPDDRFVANLVRILDGLLDGGDAGSVALLLSRPGPAEMGAADRRWAAALHAALRGRLGRWPLHLATRDRVRVFAPDDLIAA